LNEADLSATPAEAIEQGYVALCVLVDTGRRAATGMRAYLPSMSEKYRSVLATALEDMEGNHDRIEGICEAWGMASDETVSTEIKKALSDSNKRGDKEIPNWREALAALSD
jgi:hypothetical protein